ncbi:MAG: N-acetylglucosamine-6-phosphate deacetylase [Planctomycetes bacterium]|nr:N-acetylglucosamine-6-phosphate deacetylase [Planctomycetota bacterium]
MKKILIKNGLIVTPYETKEQSVLLTNGSKISDILPRKNARTAKGYETIDAGGGFVMPGFIDTHVHGALGVDALDGIGAIRKIARFNAMHGVTGMLPTTLTHPMKDLLDAVKNVRTLMLGGGVKNGAQILGIHLEGPFFHLSQRGGQPPEYIRPPRPSEYKRYLRDGNKYVRIMTLAPELPGALQLIRLLGKKGIVASAAHSTILYPDFLKAVEAGLSSVTHVYSGMAGFVRIGPYRVPGLIESALVDDRVSCEMIADAKHLPAALMKLIYKMKGADRIRLVSDATVGAGLAEGARFSLGSVSAVVHDGVAMLDDRTAFAGSVTPLDKMFANLIKFVNVPIEDAVKMTSLNAARVLGMDDRKGKLQKGYDADIVVLNRSMEVICTIVAGQIVYKG